ncbi:hypothetical protein MPDQ_001292 [Monascus purpureus]|uniref:Uncharacterized protein n=1 Tax=Monascus purpureus TaxID=5098 RepID=A0A507QRL2_MONPU|nr:hypothetical protein MPDQ_001292 [Monascus purpureus]
MATQNIAARKSWEAPADRDHVLLLGELLQGKTMRTPYAAITAFASDNRGDNLPSHPESATQSNFMSDGTAVG